MLYGALKRGVGDAQENLGPLQKNVRQAIRHREEEATRWRDSARAEWDEMVHGAVERVFKALDLPRRSDIEALNENLERVAAALGEARRRARGAGRAAARRSAAARGDGRLTGCS